MSQLLNVSLRQQAVFIPTSALVRPSGTGTESVEPVLTPVTSTLVANLSKLGFGVSGPLLTSLNRTTPGFQAQLLDAIREVMGVAKNWTPLVKGWDQPTGESFMDHALTLFANIFKEKGTKLPCGHIIPANTFPLERYNGCPFCGFPFVFGALEHYKQNPDLKVLELWTGEETAAFFKDLLESKTALDATQMDSLKVLLSELPLPVVKIGMKETLMAVIDSCIIRGQPQQAQGYFQTPTDILRYLWYKHTGFLQLIGPKTLINRKTANHRHINSAEDRSFLSKLRTTEDLKLKYDRKECLRVATWLNNLEPEVEKLAEMMHPKRGMWVRFIRALRLAEYSKREGFGKLKALLDIFYNQRYEVWQGRVDHYRLKYDAEKAFDLLKQRPGLFARSLFANMLWFGTEETIMAFMEVMDKVPARLIFTLNGYADNYFDPKADRTVKPLGSNSKNIPVNPLVTMYDGDQLQVMRDAVEELCVLVMKRRWVALDNPNKTMYIDPALFRIPLAIGDRSDTVQDLPSALMGTRFLVEGTSVRLFMQWGVGLRAQHMDMDLSCLITYKGHQERCSFSALSITGCSHSGDIRYIPEKRGTAEYIEINLPELRGAQAKYVVFSCNAYSTGNITPNLVVGWMNSRYPMTISETTGVAYDPSCVQHQVRVVNNVSKGLVFGVLEVEAGEIIWLELPFAGQLVQNLNTDTIEALIRKLNSKLSIGRVLRLKAEAQQLQVIPTADADEVYTREWAANTAAVTKILID